MTGYFAVDRGIFEHEMFDDEPFTEREAFMWLVSEAAWKETEVRTKVGRIKLARGQCVYAVRFLAQKWKWERSRVYRYLKKLISANSIRTASEHGMQQITICQYDKFQKARTGNEQETNTKRDKEEPYNHLTKDSIGADAPPDAAKILIDRGVSLLARQSEPERSARAIIGLWRKNLGDEMLFAIFDDVERNPKADLKAWVGGIIRFHKHGSQGNGISEFRCAYEQAAGRLASGEVEFGNPGAGRRGVENPLRLLSAGKAERSSDLYRSGDENIVQLSEFSGSGMRGSGVGHSEAVQIFADDSGIDRGSGR